VEIMIVVAIIALLAAIAIPNFVRARNSSQQNACISNMRQIDSGISQWALENKKSDTDTPTSGDISVYIKNNHFPQCAGGGRYIMFNLGATGPLVVCTKVFSAYPHSFQMEFLLGN
jgi:type II secretory pathway pseudopilin PulG